MRDHMVNHQIFGVVTPAFQARIDAGENLTRLWHGEMQQIPANMWSAPVVHVGAMASALPGVKRLRVAFNQHCFNPDGALHPDYEAFLAAAAAQGYEMLWVLMDGPSQESGKEDRADLPAHWPASYPPVGTLSQWQALMPHLASRHQTAWTRLLAWLAAHPGIPTHGFEAINEPAAYGRAAARYPSSGAFFFEAYVDHVEAIRDLVMPAHPAAKFYIGGWNYSATFLELRDAWLPSRGMTALRALREIGGAALVWSIHLYPHWAPNLNRMKELDAWLDARFRPILGEAAVITETQCRNSEINDPRLLTPVTRAAFMMARAADWFRRRGMGIGYWPVVNWSESYMFRVMYGGSIKCDHQNSLSGAYAAFTAGNHPDFFTGSASGHRPILRIATDYLADAPSDPEVIAGQDPVDSPPFFAYGFGGAGVCVVTGAADANNFLYGGDGRNVLVGGPNDDHLWLGRGGGIIRCNGGWNVATTGGGAALIYGGPVHNIVSVYRGSATVVCDPAGVTLIYGFDPAKGDRLSFKGAIPHGVALQEALSVAPAGGSIAGEANLVVRLPQGGRVILWAQAALAARLGSFVLDLTSGWYAPGWTEPADYAEADFALPIVPPVDEAAAFGIARTRSGTQIIARRRDGTPVSIAA